jgi:CHASE2 domain-containing sensor protein
MPKVSKKSKSELEKDFVEKVRRAVVSAGKRTEKITQYARSKKYALTDAQKAKILDQYDKMSDAIAASFAAPEKVAEEDSFKL